VARLATVSADGLPHIVPVTFAVPADVLTARRRQAEDDPGSRGAPQHPRSQESRCSPVTTT
jgi:hypothetical protein